MDACSLSQFRSPEIKPTLLSQAGTEATPAQKGPEKGLVLFGVVSYFLVFFF